MDSLRDDTMTTILPRRYTNALALSLLLCFGAFSGHGQSGGAPKSVTLSPSNLSFKNQTVQLTNGQTTPITISSVSTTGDFRVAASSTCTAGLNVLAGATCNIDVTFTPTATGTRSGVLTVVDTGANSPHTAALSGVGVAPPLTLSAASLNFAKQIVGTTSASQAVTITNNSGSTIRNIVVLSSTADFPQNWGCPTSLKNGESCTASWSFAPTATGLRSSTVSITDSTNVAQTISLSGLGYALASISVSPANPAVPLGLKQQFTATGNYTDGSTQNLTGTVGWASGSPAVATISAAGLATTLGVGSTNITASSGSVTGSAALTVSAPAVVSIIVTPANPSVAAGLTQQFAATGTFTDGGTQNITNSVNWSSSNTAAATINAAGLAGTVAQGATTIQAVSGTVTGSTTLTVIAPALVSIAVTPSNASAFLCATQDLAAT